MFDCSGGDSETDINSSSPNEGGSAGFGGVEEELTFITKDTLNLCQEESLRMTREKLAPRFQSLPISRELLQQQQNETVSGVAQRTLMAIEEMNDLFYDNATTVNELTNGVLGAFDAVGNLLYGGIHPQAFFDDDEKNTKIKTRRSQSKPRKERKHMTTQKNEFDTNISSFETLTGTKYRPMTHVHSSRGISASLNAKQKTAVDQDCHSKTGNPTSREPDGFVYTRTPVAKRVLRYKCRNPMESSLQRRYVVKTQSKFGEIKVPSKDGVYRSRRRDKAQNASRETRKALSSKVVKLSVPNESLQIRPIPTSLIHRDRESNTKYGKQESKRRPDVIRLIAPPNKIPGVDPRLPELLGKIDKIRDNRVKRKQASDRQLRKQRKENRKLTSSLSSPLNVIESRTLLRPLKVKEVHKTAVERTRTAPTCRTKKKRQESLKQLEDDFGTLLNKDHQHAGFFTKTGLKLHPPQGNSLGLLSLHLGPTEEKQTKKLKSELAKSMATQTSKLTLQNQTEKRMRRLRQKLRKRSVAWNTGRIPTEGDMDQSLRVASLTGDNYCPQGPSYLREHLFAMESKRNNILKNMKNRVQKLKASPVSRKEMPTAVSGWSQHGSRRAQSEVDIANTPVPSNYVESRRQSIDPSNDFSGFVRSFKSMKVDGKLERGHGTIIHGVDKRELTLEKRELDDTLDCRITAMGWPPMQYPQHEFRDAPAYIEVPENWHAQQGYICTSSHTGKQQLLPSHARFYK